jgi:hypothetical protein
MRFYPRKLDSVFQIGYITHINFTTATDEGLWYPHGLTELLPDGKQNITLALFLNQRSK